MDRADSIRIDAESDEYEVVSVVAIPPTWRDVWAILRGRYRPKVRKRKTATMAGVSRTLREVYSSDKLKEQLSRPSPLLK